MIKTYKELREIDLEIGELYQSNPNLKNTKFGYGYKRFMEKNYLPLLNEYQLAQSDIRIDNALTNETTKELLTDPSSPRGFKYSKEGLKNCIKQENALQEDWLKKETEITPYIVKEIPPEISPELTEKLKGLMIE